MAILNFTTDVMGQIGQAPRVVKIVSTDNYATITSAGYLNFLPTEQLAIYPTDEIHISYAGDAFGIFLPTFSGQQITLVPWNGTNLNPALQGLHIGLTSSWNGGSTSHGFTIPGLTSSSIVVAAIARSTNPSSIVDIVTTTDTLTVTFSADPGTGTILNFVSTPVAF